MPMNQQVDSALFSPLLHWYLRLIFAGDCHKATTVFSFDFQLNINRNRFMGSELYIQSVHIKRL